MAALLLTRLEWFHEALLHLGNLGYIGAFFAGILFVSTFTVAIGIIVLSMLDQYLSPVEIGLLAGAGAVIGDLLIFQYVKNKLSDEIFHLYEQIGGTHLTKIVHTKYFSWTFPVFGALIIASPLPDEIGVSLMGIAKMKTRVFILLSFLLNATGIFLVVTLAETFK